jgi:hypothetical protein
MPLFRRRTPPIPTENPAPPAPALVDTTFPQWALSSIFDWLRPFLHEGTPLDSGFGLQSDHDRDFLREVERNLRLSFNWQHGHQSAFDSLAAEIQRDPAVLVKVVDFALRNILIGYTFQDYDRAAGELDRILREAGSVWCVRETPGRVECFLERRADPAAGEAIRVIANEAGRDNEHLSRAWQLAYGQSPNPGEAYREAVKAVEVVAIPVVLPNDPAATLGKVIASMRQSPTKWKSVFGRSVTPATGARQTPVEVAIQMLDLLWKNQTDRHGIAPDQPAAPISQEQAELAVNLALTLVQLFRAGGVTTV